MRLLAVPLVALAAFSSGIPAAQSPAARTGGPWVPFEASFTRTEPGMRKIVGWFHRASDGSTREESNLDGPASPVVFITNVARGLQLVLENRAWTSYPMHLPPGGLNPDAGRRDPRYYAAAKPIGGIEVVRFVNPQGIVLFQAPKLNYFAVRSEKPNGGREEFSEIVIREQPAELFDPPPGATVHAREDAWRGPLWYTAGQNPGK